MAPRGTPGLALIVYWDCAYREPAERPLNASHSGMIQTSFRIGAARGVEDKSLGRW